VAFTAREEPEKPVVALQPARGERMKLGLYLGYSGARADFSIDLVKRAERLGYDSV
jgi:hypothetical protein